MFAIDTRHLTSVVYEFFDDYSGGDPDKDFQINFVSLVALLNARIRNEEELLYHEYEEIKSNYPFLI